MLQYTTKRLKRKRGRGSLLSFKKTLNIYVLHGDYILPQKRGNTEWRSFFQCFSANFFIKTTGFTQSLQEAGPDQAYVYFEHISRQKYSVPSINERHFLIAFNKNAIDCAIIERCPTFS